jgi:hypothetical protein
MYCIMMGFAREECGSFATGPMLTASELDHARTCWAGDAALSIAC